ncbi:MAG TPA: hypothetical protein VMB50_03805 [Myxococcales bacterium]|nr:hypothetical protein [Myxococcales bacterium]
MKRIWIYSIAGLLAPLALTFATPALADSQNSRSNSQPYQGQMMAPQAGSMASSGMTPAETGVVQGTVRAINFRAGILEINSAGRTIALHAKPDQLADFQPGDLVSVNYDDFAGVLWLASNMNEGSIGNQNFAISGTVTGTVSALNKARGYLTLMGPTRNQTFLAHPLDIKNLVPGQFVSLSFERIGGRDWVSSIQEAPSNAPVNEGTQR